MIVGCGVGWLERFGRFGLAVAMDNHSHSKQPCKFTLLTVLESAYERHTNNLSCWLTSNLLCFCVNMSLCYINYIII